jgi:hypothetical protein
MFPQAYSPGITFAPDVENPGPLVGFKASLRADDPGDHLEALEGRLVNGGQGWGSAQRPGRRSSGRNRPSESRADRLTRIPPSGSSA